MEEQIKLFLSSGSGSGYGYGDGIKTFNGDKVYIIDDIPTIIKHIHDNVAKGYILNDDFTLTKTFVAKENGNSLMEKHCTMRLLRFKKNCMTIQPRRKG